MYGLEFILILLIILILYFYVFNDNRILIEAFNNKKYLLVPTTDKSLLKEKANTLAKLNEVAITLADKMYKNKIPNKKTAELLYNRLKTLKFAEVKLGDTSTAYTLNKSQEIGFCLVDKKTKKLINFDDLKFVLLHELAHVMSESLGHGEEFQINFEFIVKLAIKLKLWKDLKYEENNKNICGTTVTTSPCSNHNGCTSYELDEYFKESLLD